MAGSGAASRAGSARTLRKAGFECGQGGGAVMSERITGAEALVRCLEAEGVEVLFGYPGGVALPIFDALYDSKQIRTILPRHEQGAVHMADGYARVTGRPGVALV